MSTRPQGLAPCEQLDRRRVSHRDARVHERLRTDFQITLYAGYLEKVLGIRITGIIYNVLAKAKLRQSKGETEAEYEARCAELIDGLARCEPNPRPAKKTRKIQRQA